MSKNKIKFTITREDIENSFEIFEFSVYEKYHTIKFVDKKQVLNSDVSGYDIKAGKVDIKNDEYEIWEKSVHSYINAHNTKVLDGQTDNSIEFIITDIDSRFACKFEKKINGKTIQNGRGWLKDLKSNEEKNAWRQAVVRYKKNNGITTATQDIENILKEIDDNINSMDNGLPEYINLIPPLIETAIMEISTDPCRFITDLKKAAHVSISKINGIPNPIELSNYYIKLIKNNIQIAKNITANSQTSLVKSYGYPINDEIYSSIEYFKQLDAEREEYLKTHANDIALFETCIQKPYVYTKTYKYDEDEETSYNGVSIDDINNIEFSTYDISGRGYKEVEPNIIAKGGLLRSSAPNRNISILIYNNIYEALHNCWTPLRIAWGDYCKEKGWDPTWNITSGYRPDSANKGSAHGIGWAIDVQPVAKNKEERRKRVITLSSFIYQYCKTHRNIKVDQILREFDGYYKTWCHIGYKRPLTKEQRGHYYTNYDTNGDHGEPLIV